MTSRRFQIGAATLSANDPQLAPALADAHARRIRPLCLCRKPAAPMYVAQVAGQFIPKRMPGTGAQHDPGCESYAASRSCPALARWLAARSRRMSMRA